VVEEHHRLRDLIAALPVAEPVALAAPQPVAKKRATAKKVPARPRAVTPAPVVAPRRTRKSAASSARAA